MRLRPFGGDLRVVASYVAAAVVALVLALLLSLVLAMILVSALHAQAGPPRDAPSGPRRDAAGDIPPPGAW